MIPLYFQGPPKPRVRKARVTNNLPYANPDLDQKVVGLGLEPLQLKLLVDKLNRFRPVKEGHQ